MIPETGYNLQNREWLREVKRFQCPRLLKDHSMRQPDDEQMRRVMMATSSHEKSELGFMPSSALGGVAFTTRFILRLHTLTQLNFDGSVSLFEMRISQTIHKLQVRLLGVLGTGDFPIAGD